jgi:predicted 2-oxoglutarate/Fe(II)-dependent dioxygenase YbiX
LGALRGGSKRLNLNRLIVIPDYLDVSGLDLDGYSIDPGYNAPTLPILDRDLNHRIYNKCKLDTAHLQATVENTYGVQVRPDTTYGITAYRPGSSFGLHTDSQVHPGGLITSVKSTFRDITTVVYLNDKYTGGELSFPNCGITVTPKPGTLIMFPATPVYNHAVSVIKSGVRFAVSIFWVLKK